MIALDTNVVSELMRSAPAPAVQAWLASQSFDELFLAAPSVAEIRYGAIRLPAGKRRQGLITLYEEVLDRFDKRVLPFNLQAVECYADIIASRETAGNPINVFDALIAATALAHNASIATRDLGGFQGCGIALIDPWAG